MSIEDIGVAIGEEEIHGAIQDFLGDPRETHHAMFRRSIRELAIERGATAEMAAELSEHVGRVSDSWPTGFIVYMDTAAKLPDATVSFLCQVGLVPMDSAIATDEIREGFKKQIKDDERYRHLAKHLAARFANDLGDAHDGATGLMDDEIDALSMRILELPAAIGPTVHRATPPWIYTLFSLLGLSGLPIPDPRTCRPKYGQQIEPEPGAPASGVDHLRRALWRLADDPTKSAPELHVHVESTLARMLEQPEFFQHSIATWAYHLPDSARALLVAAKIVGEDSPLSGGPDFLKKLTIPLVRHANGRWIARAIALDVQYLTQMRMQKREELVKRLYNETPLFIYPLLLYLTREEAKCLVEALGLIDPSIIDP